MPNDQPTNPDDGEFDAFLSHNGQDKPVIRTLTDSLEACGLRVWLDERELRPGLTWMDALEKIIHTCKAAAVCIGPNGVGPWEEPEMQALLRRFVREKKGRNILPVIPVLLPDAPADVELPVFLDGFTWVDVREGLDEEGIAKLVWGITGKKPSRRQVPPAPAPGPSAERLAELTAHARQSIAAEATRWLDSECAPFVVPSLSRRKPQIEWREMTDLRDPWEPLSEQEIQALILGRVPEAANRVRIVGDSGMGKTALLHYCEARIASGDDGRLPVRLEMLSGYDWKRNRSELLEMIAERTLHTHLPRDATVTERRDWLEELVDNGRVVFLLDALDQTDKQLNHAGLRAFLQCAGVGTCPVLMTLRPEVESSAVFAGTDWSTLRTDAFDEPRQREFLGDTADALLPVKEENWRDRESYQRKLQWADLLSIPLLLKMMRGLARAQIHAETGVSLSDLGSRHALYRQAVADLVKKGLEATEASQHRGKLDGPGEVIEFLTEIGWRTVHQGSGKFTAVFEGEPFKQLRRERREFLPALKQVDLVTRHAVLDDYDKDGLAWRHRSFSEYFAGLHLAGMESEERKTVLQQHGRDPRWYWVFRFALGEASRRDASLTEDMAGGLIRFGNPFLLFDAIDQDGLEVADYIERLCRWLVHRDRAERDYRSAWRELDPPNLDARWVGILESLFERANRDSRCLHPAWQLVSSCEQAWSARVRERFLGEFSAILADRSSPQHPVAESLVAASAFVRCPPDPENDGQPFRMGSPAGDADAVDDERPQHEVRVKPFSVQRAPVTNGQFELFDPSHSFRRDQYSPSDDHPAIRVSWYMADLFCRWLGNSSRLPTEAEWEYAARAGTTTRYWWGDTFDSSKCNSLESGHGHTLPAERSRANPWGLIDMLGNVWEWCQDWFGEYLTEDATDPAGPSVGSDRVVRGGSWFYTARDCRSAYRFRSSPDDRDYDLGFRVARSPSGR